MYKNTILENLIEIPPPPEYLVPSTDHRERVDRERIKSRLIPLCLNFLLSGLDNASERDGDLFYAGLTSEVFTGDNSR